MYLDSTEEALSFYDTVSDPYKYVLYTPTLFNRWCQWARNYKTNNQDQLRPFGQKLGPDWMRSDFDNLEIFYQFYTDLIRDI